MAIDLSACDGCGACVVACGAENNVPVVGREEVRRGREMHWMRMDRYYSTPLDPSRSKDDDYSDSLQVYEVDPENLTIHHQPMLCQQCAHAPCEEVCPAMATMHSDEGINLMVYNRCIGTRFCANNCPYKVRRFNFYEYTKYRKGPATSDPFDRVAKNLLTEGATSSQAEMAGGAWDDSAPLQMLLNPAVTVRSKGVMEKCNFCLQRTRDIREVEKRSNSKYDDTDMTLTSACAQTCPSGAITFGDINDPFSQVSQAGNGNPHGYRVLDNMINTRPAITYLREVRNVPATPAERAELTGEAVHVHDENCDHGDHGTHGDEHAAARSTLFTEGQA
jgi:molybdopterin-containing oxidoreductase family iron-sulfur binding subunit